MRKKIESELAKIFKSKDYDWNITVSEKLDFGHFATTLPLRLAKTEKRAPLEAAAKLKETIAQELMPGLFSRVEFAPPGFINFWLAPGALQKELSIINKEKAKYGRSAAKKEKIQLEYVSANPTGPLTLANGRGGFFGDTLANALISQGYKVEREYYVNDTGNQIVVLGKSVLAAAGLIPIEENFYKAAYVAGWAKAHKALIKKHIADPHALGRLAAADFLKDIKHVLGAKAGIKFDRWTSEYGHIHQKGLVEKALAALKKSGEVYKEEGAVWLRTTSFGDDKDRVLITTDGFPTYLLADAGHYLETKMRGFDRKINILGPDHHGYVKRIQAAAQILGLKKSEVLVTQAIRLIRRGEEVKMSKRKGEFIAFEELVDEVGLDAARFFMLMVALDTHMDFDLELAKERSLKNPVYYVQYSYVRAMSIIKKAQIKGGVKPQEFVLLTGPDAIALIFKLTQFPDILERASQDFGVHRLTHYAIELSRAFHAFYERERIIGAEPKLARARGALVAATAVVLKNLFDLLGISAPQKM